MASSRAPFSVLRLIQFLCRLSTGPNAILWGSPGALHYDRKFDRRCRMSLRSDVDRHPWPVWVIRVASARDARGTSAVPPIPTELVLRNERSRCAIRRYMQCSKPYCYSITSSALTRSVFGTLKPRAFAVLRLITNSNLVGCSTGKSAGFSPLKMRAT